MSVSMLFLITVTVLCLAVPVYVYAGYPALLWLATRLTRTQQRRTSDDLPTVTLVISCYNEGAVIGKKLDNALALDYPADRLDILVVSDGSEDGTDEIVRARQANNLRLIRQEGRLGKTMGLNLALEQTDAEIVVFSDANALYAPDALRKLVRHFADDKVGYVVGAALYTDGEESAAAHDENLYWRYELAMKLWESQLYSVVGGDGAIYAIRRSLWQPLQQRDINDFVNPLQIVAAGYQGVFDPEARCFEETAGDHEREAARKQRIVNRSIRGLMRVKSVMNPLRFPRFSWMVISHKLLRWLIPLFAVLGVAGSAVLSALGNSLFQLVILGAAFLTLLAALGYSLQHLKQLPVWLSFPYYFVMVNLYALRGILQAVRGETQVTWQSTRPGQRSGTASGARRRGQLWFGVILTGLLISLGLGYV